MNEIFSEFIRTKEGFFSDHSHGDSYRCSATLKDGTFLPCVILRDIGRYLNEIIPRLNALDKRKSFFSKKHTNDNYENILKLYLTSGNRINNYDIKSLTKSKFAMPESLLNSIEGETTMGWTGFVLEMHDGSIFQYGTTYLVQFFDIPEKYSFEDVMKVHNHSYLNAANKIVRLQEGFMDIPDDYDISNTYRERPFFDCYVDLN
ncbi:MAG: hypothetical protein F9K24_18110 [Leptonema illini]|uniref:Uncharacterized protein n=1 Tax=Leptonema illini TaxID=183 RepID=A0A833GYB9_9LEPT|nr:MAG: hypothetical protein F9K24_18110 [Leptonema illini]